MSLTPITDHEVITAGYDEAKEAEESAFTRTPYAKLSSGSCELRFLPSFEESRKVPYTTARLHRFHNEEGKFTNAMDYGFLLEQPELVAAAIEAGRITQDDIAAADTYGDPFMTLRKLLRDVLGLKNEDCPSKVFSKARSWFLVVPRDGDNEGTISILEVGTELRDRIMGCMKLEPGLFRLEDGFDVLIQGNGKDGFARRYPTVGPRREPSEVGVELTEDTVPSLNEKLVWMILPYADKVSELFRLFPSECEEVGISYETFGCAEPEDDSDADEE